MADMTDPEIQAIVDEEVDGLKRKVHELIGDKKKLQAKIRCLEDRMKEARDLLARSVK